MKPFIQLFRRSRLIWQDSPIQRTVLFHLGAWFLSAAMVWGLAFKWIGRSESELFEGARLYVYRQFVPMIARGLMAFGFRADVAVILVVFMMTVGFAYSLRYFYATFWQDTLRGDVITFAGLEGLFLLILLETKFYDLSTAFLFALGLAFMARAQLIPYYFLFLLACLNRETAFLLTLVFTVYFWGKLRVRDWIAGIFIQILMFALVRLGLMLAFASVQGPAYIFRPIEHLHEMIDHPRELFEFVGVIALILVLSFRGWKEKPAFLRTAFLVLGPSLMILYLLFGSGFEIRVFVEMYAVAILMVLNPKGLNRSVAFTA